MLFSSILDSIDRELGQKKVVLCLYTPLTWSRQDCLVSCRRWCEQSWRQSPTVSSSPHWILCSHHISRQSWLVANSVHTADMDRLVWSCLCLQCSCPCRQCELGVKLLDKPQGLKISINIATSFLIIYIYHTMVAKK